MSIAAEFLDRNIAPGDWLWLDGGIYELTDHLDDMLSLVARIDQVDDAPSGGDLGHVLINIAELFTSKTSSIFAKTRVELQKKLVVKAIGPAANEVIGNAVGMRQSFLDKADEIIELVEGVEKLIPDFRPKEGQTYTHTAAIRWAIKTFPEQRCLATYYNYRRLYHMFSGRRAHIALYFHRETFRKSKMPATTLHLVDFLIGRYYNHDELRLTPRQVYRRLQQTLIYTNGLWIDPAKCLSGIPEDLLTELDLKKIPFSAIKSNPEKMALLDPAVAPSRSWFYAYLRHYLYNTEAGRQIIRERYGEEYYEREFLVWDHYANRAAYPLEFTFADHWEIAMYIVDKEGRAVLYKLWCTMIIDAYSRSILGFALLPHSPNITSIQAALKHAIFPKGDELRAFGIDPLRWTAFGILIKVFLDNAWAHLSESLETLGREISCNGEFNSIELVFRPPYMARYGGLIERLFGNLEAKIKSLIPGVIITQDKDGIALAKKSARYLYQDLYQTVLKLVVDYQHTVHSAIGMTPHEKWQEGIRNTGIPRIPTFKDYPDLEYRFYPLLSGSKTIGESGVSIDGVSYRPDSPNTPRKDGNGLIHYQVHMSETNVSEIHLFHVEGGPRVDRCVGTKLLRPDGSMRPISKAERELAKAYARDANKRPSQWADYLSVDEVLELSAIRGEEREIADRRAGAPPNGPVRSPAQADQALADGLDELTENQYTQLLRNFNGVNHKA